MRFSVELNRDVPVIRPETKTIEYTDEAEAFIRSAYQEELTHSRAIVIDLSHVTEFELGGLVVLIGLKQHLEEDGFSLVVADSNQLLQGDNLLCAVIADNLHVCSCVAEAIEYLDSRVQAEIPPHVR